MAVNIRGGKLFSLSGATSLAVYSWRTRQKLGRMHFDSLQTHAVTLRRCLSYGNGLCMAEAKKHPRHQLVMLGRYQPAARYSVAANVSVCRQLWHQGHIHKPLFHTSPRVGFISLMQSATYSNGAESQGTVGSKKLSNTDKVKIVVKEYGTVAIIFHTCISLFSLGSCYLAVSNGLDVSKFLEYFNIHSSSVSKGASTFAIAYVLHKVFLPLRATITVASVPLIVRQLRARGWMKGTAKQAR